MASDFDLIIQTLRTSASQSRGAPRYPLAGVRKVIADQVAMFKEGQPIEEIYNYVADEAESMRSVLLHIYALNIACQMHEAGEPCFTRVQLHNDAIRRLRGTTMEPDRSALRHSSPEALGQIELYTRLTVKRLGRNEFNRAGDTTVKALSDLGLRDKVAETPKRRANMQTPAHAAEVAQQQLAS